MNVTSRYRHPSGTHRYLYRYLCCQQSYSQNKQRNLERCSHTGADTSTCLGVDGSALWIDPHVDSKIYKLKCLPSAATRVCVTDCGTITRDIDL